MLEALYDQRLPVALEPACAHVQSQAVPLEGRCVMGLIEVQLGGLDVVDRSSVVSLADGFLIPGPLGSLLFAFRSLDGYLRQIGLLLARQHLTANLDLLSGQPGVQAIQRGAFALVFVL